MQLHYITKHKREDRSEKAAAVAHERWRDVNCRLARCRVTGEVSQVGENGYRCPAIHNGEHLETFNGNSDEALVRLLKVPGCRLGRQGLQGLHRTRGHWWRASHALRICCLPRVDRVPGRRCPQLPGRGRDQRVSIARRRPLRGDILLFLRAFPAPLGVVKYRNYQSVLQDKRGLSQ